MNNHYVAGIVDGEGWIGIKKNIAGGNGRWNWARDCSYCPCIKVAQSEKGLELIELLKDEFGGFVSKRIHNGERENNSYEWSLTAKKNILPFLTKIKDKLILKKEQAEIVCEYYNDMNKRVSPSLSDEEVIRREKLYQSIKKLNFRGLAETE